MLVGWGNMIPGRRLVGRCGEVERWWVRWEENQLKYTLAKKMLQWYLTLCVLTNIFKIWHLEARPSYFTPGIFLGEVSENDTVTFRSYIFSFETSHVVLSHSFALLCHGDTLRSPMGLLCTLTFCYMYQKSQGIGHSFTEPRAWDNPEVTVHCDLFHCVWAPSGKHPCLLLAVKATDSWTWETTLLHVLYLPLSSWDTNQCDAYAWSANIPPPPMADTVLCFSFRGPELPTFLHSAGVDLLLGICSYVGGARLLLTLLHSVNC